MAAVVFAVASLAGSCGFQTGTDHPDAPSTDKDPLNASWSFAVWAPNAEAVFVQGDFNDWSETSHPMQADGAGHWQAGIRGAKPGDDYQFVIHYQGRTLYRPDPRARALTSSIGHSVIVDSNGYQWQHAGVQLPSWNEQIIYELHIGSFNDVPGGGPGTFLTAIERLDALAELGVNIVELLPINEFSGDFSWGYNGSHPFALESGYGTPDEFRAFVDAAHARGIGVIVDVVYNHWGPQDLSLWCFDGPCYGEGNGGIYFYTDWRRESGWGPRPNFGQEEVRDFIADNAMMWLDEYRVDGLRFDSTINIRKASGTDLPEGWSLLQQINDRVDARYPGRMMIAEDLQGDDWVTKQTSDGGAGFDAQWDGGFFHPIHEALIATEDAHRSMPAVAQALRGGLAPFTRIAYTENHDEVANGKQRLPVMIAPGDPSGYYARKRSMLGATLVLTTPAIPMLFQGQEMLEDGYFRDDDPVD